MIKRIMKICSKVIACLVIAIVGTYLIVNPEPCLNYPTVTNDICGIKVRTDIMVSSHTVEETVRAIELLPDALTQSFIDNRIDFKICSDKLWQGKPNSDGYNTVDITSRQVLDIRVRVGGNSAVKYRQVVIHEFGHYLDSITGWTSGSDEFIMIKDSEYDSKHYAEYYLQEREWFAENFSNYVTRPKWLKEKCPMTYDFIDKTIQKIQA